MTPEDHNPNAPAARPSPPLPPLLPTGQRWVLGLAVVAVIGVACVLIFSEPEPEPKVAIAWQNTSLRTDVDARKSDKRRLLFFTADWCGPCKVLKHKTLAQPMVADTINRRYQPLRIDLTDRNSPEQLLARDWRVDSIPTLLVVGSDGKEVARVVGVLSPDEALAWLEKNAR